MRSVALRSSRKGFAREGLVLKQVHVRVAVAIAVLAFAAAADARPSFTAARFRGTAETADGRPGAVTWTFTEIGLKPGAAVTYDLSAMINSDLDHRYRISGGNGGYTNPTDGTTWWWSGWNVG